VYRLFGAHFQLNARRFAAMKPRAGRQVAGADDRRRRPARRIAMARQSANSGKTEGSASGRARSAWMGGLAAALALVLASPAPAQGDPAGEIDPMQSAAWHNQQSLALARLRWQDGWRVLPGGVRWRPVIGNGSGPHPTVNDTVTVHYAGSFIDGSEFDSSFGGEPATFPLRALIPAWQLAVPQMGVGDTIEIAAPADQAYGTAGRGPIPGGATLFFRIALIGIPGRP
jgi:FKBP-type peptidyl-prolyl cis-trans isomerase FkpA